MLLTTRVKLFRMLLAASLNGGTIHDSSLSGWALVFMEFE
jgi:hypothetical protein